MASRRRTRLGVTLIELLLTIAVLAILAAVLIPQLSGDLPERLNAASQVISADLDYARSMAVSNNSSYRITFDKTNNSYALQHTGANPTLNTLPRSPFRQVDEPVTQQTTNLSMLPLPEPGVRLVTIVQMQGTGQTATTVEFTALGGTTSSSQTMIWLTCGSGNVQRYVSISVDPITGLVSIGQPRSSLPSTIQTLVQQSQATEATQAGS